MKNIILITCIVSFISCKAQQPSANQIIEKIKSNVTVEWKEPTVDNIKAGDGNTKVTGVASTFMATMEVLQKAKAKGYNFIITHEPTFYNHQDDLSIHGESEVQKAKLKFIADNNMVVWRFHDYMHRTDPDQIYKGLINQLGWQKYKNEGEPTFNIPRQTLKELVSEIQSKIGAKTIRVVGNAKMEFSKVGFVLGAAGTEAHFKMLANPNCDVLIVGETNEWETVPYVQDAITLGQKKALIVMGHADSEEAGMIYFNDWLQQLYPSLKIGFIEAGNPYWNGGN